MDGDTEKIQNQRIHTYEMVNMNESQMEDKGENPDTTTDNESHRGSEKG